MAVLRVIEDWLEFEVGGGPCSSQGGIRGCLHPPQETSHLAPFRHEEADIRMILHLADAINKGFHNILLHTVARDEVVLSVAAAAKVDVQEVW